MHNLRGKIVYATGADTGTVVQARKSHTKTAKTNK